MSGRRPNPEIPDPCPECSGWGGHIVGRGTDREDSEKCLACDGTGIRRKWPTCDVVPGNPAAWWRKATCGCEENVCWGHRRMQIESGPFHCPVHDQRAQWFLEKEFRP